MIDLIFSGRNLFILYLALAGSFLVPLIPCQSTRLIGDAMGLRHILGFITLVFFIVSLDTQLDEYMPLGTILLTSVLLYVWFMVASKMTANWWIMIAILLAGIYLLDLYEQQKQAENPETRSRITLAKRVILGTSIFLTLVGFLLYVGEKKLEYKRTFSYSTLLLGTPMSKGTPSNRPYGSSLVAAFSDISRPGMIGGGIDTLESSDLGSLAFVPIRTGSEFVLN